MNVRTMILPVLLLGALLTGCNTTQPQRGVLIMAHGGSDQWNEAVEQAVGPIREKYPTALAYGMARQDTMEQAVRELEAQGVEEVAVVRLFISGDSFLDRTETLLGLNDAEPPRAVAASHHKHDHHGAGHAEHGSNGARDHDSGGHSHHMGPVHPITTHLTFKLSRTGVAESPLVDEILVERVEATLSEDPGRERVLILAHGPADDAENERWLAQMRLRAQALCEVGSFAHVQVETLREDWAQRRAQSESRIRRYVEAGTEAGERVIVVPFRVAGFGPYARVLEGLEYVADEQGFCPHPLMTRWIEQTAQACFAAAPEAPAPTGQRVAERAQDR
ncbi:MAG: hypothetical protein WD009_14730 [Phycisphaeraceae bacterium]